MTFIVDTNKITVGNVDTETDEGITDLGVVGSNADCLATNTKASDTVSLDQDTGAISKNRQKKLEKRERAKQKKLEKKRLEREGRVAAAIREGRDLEAERKYQEERTLSGDRQRRLDEIWATKRKEAEDSRRFQICIDLGSRLRPRRSSNRDDIPNGSRDESSSNCFSSFEAAMREREIASLAQQIRYCYSYNKKSQNPVLATVTGLSHASNVADEGRDFPSVRQLLERETGFADWKRRMFDCTEASLEEYYGLIGSDVVRSDQEESSHSPRRPKIVYLTSDSTTTLQCLEEDTVYVIGGIVDRNRLKYATIRRAEDSLGVETARLPLQEYLIENNIEMSTTKVLTVNHVFDILLRFRQHGNDWGKAIQDVLPSRKV